MQILLQHIGSFSYHQGTNKTNNSNVLLSYVFCSDFNIKTSICNCTPWTTCLWKSNVTGSCYCTILMLPLAMQMPGCCQSCFTEVSHSSIELWSVNPACVCILLWLQEVCTVGRWWSGTPVELKTPCWFRVGCQQTATESLFITWVHQQPPQMLHYVGLCDPSV